MAHGVILGQTLNTNNLLPLDGSRAMTGALNMDSHKITNLSNGTANNDAVNYYQLMNSTVSASRISGTLSTSNIPNLSASKITSGTFSTSRIPDLDASQITSGQFNTARIPNLSASKITSGVLSVANGGTGVSSLDALYSGLITKTVLQVDGRKDFFGDGIKTPFLVSIRPQFSMSVKSGNTTYFITDGSENNNLYLHLNYCVLNDDEPFVNFTLNDQFITHQIRFIDDNIVQNYTWPSSDKFDWVGTGTVIFYSFT